MGSLYSNNVISSLHIVLMWLIFQAYICDDSGIFGATYVKFGWTRDRPERTSTSFYLPTSATGKCWGQYKIVGLALFRKAELTLYCYLKKKKSDKNEWWILIKFGGRVEEDKREINVLDGAPQYLFQCGIESMEITHLKKWICICLGLMHPGNTCMQNYFVGRSGSTL